MLQYLKSTRRSAKTPISVVRGSPDPAQVSDRMSPRLFSSENSWPSWQSSVFCSVSQVLKLTKMSDFNEFQSYCRCVGCGRVFEAHQFQTRHPGDHHEKSWPSWPSSVFCSVSQVLKLTKMSNFNEFQTYCRFVGCGRVFEADQFQTWHSGDHREKRWLSWPSSLFCSVSQVLKLTKLANFDEFQTYCRFVGCGRVFEAHQFQTWPPGDHHEKKLAKLTEFRVL